MKLILILVLLIGSTLGDMYNAEHILERQKSIEEISGVVEEIFWNEYKDFVPGKPKSKDFLETLDLLKQSNETMRMEIENIPAPQQGALCIMCRSMFTVLINHRRNGADDAFMRSLVVDLCNGIELFTPAVCSGVVDLNLPIFMHIIDNRPNLDSRILCGTVLQGSNCIANDPSMEWTINVAGGGPPITQSKYSIPERSPNDLTVIHISDNHYDPHYREGANAVCGEPVCCRVLQGFPSDVTKRAGRWGDYRDCDTPWEQFEDVIERVKSTHQNIDLIYFTGDILDHGIWETTFIGNLHSITRSNDIFKKEFPGVPVFPVLGNHESHPTNQFAPHYLNRPDLTTQWLYDFIWEEWRAWLPQSESTIKTAGYYTYLVRPGFRIVGLNNNDCYTYNWWLLYDFRYPIPQLQWFHDTLLAAEQAGEKVHIVTHMPSGGGSCFKVWAREFRRVMDRFWNTVSGQFNGHTHRDQFNIYYSRENSDHAINVAWNGGCSTTFSYVNPNYRVYHVEQETYQVTEHDTYIFNLTLANINRDQNPNWFREYSFKEFYGLRDLSPASLNELVEEFARDHNKLYQYWRLNSKLADPVLEAGCDNNCLATFLCRIVITEHGENTVCNRLLEIFWAHAK